MRYYCEKCECEVHLSGGNKETSYLGQQCPNCRTCDSDLYYAIWSQENEGISSVA